MPGPWIPNSWCKIKVKNLSAPTSSRSPLSMLGWYLTQWCFLLPQEQSQPSEKLVKRVLGSELLFTWQFGPDSTDHSHERSLNERGTPTLSEALFYGTYLLIWISNIRTASTVRWTGAGQRGTGDIENVFRWSSVRMIAVHKPPQSRPGRRDAATDHGRGWRGQASDLDWTMWDMRKLTFISSTGNIH